ncbi:MAG: acylphosphatase [Bacteroidota bacterium]
MKHVNITLTGKVQRVGFRFYSMEAAARYSINGFIMNSGHDQVYIEAEGSDENIHLFLSWCRKGPVGARVDNLEMSEAPLKNFSGYKVVHRDEFLKKRPFL